VSELGEPQMEGMDADVGLVRRGVVRRGEERGVLGRGVGWVSEWGEPQMEGMDADGGLFGEGWARKTPSGRGGRGRGLGC
jgi:hypothetical protein